MRRVLEDELNNIQKASSTASSASLSSPPPLLPVIGWKAFPSGTIPESFCYGSIYSYIIETARLTGDSGENSADLGTAKPMQKGRQYFTSGHVMCLQDAVGKGHYLLKCEVRASYSNQIYHISVTIDSDSVVVDDSCECKASAMGRCSHVAALLFALEDYTLNFGHEPVSCTSKLCQWNVGRKKQNSPQALHSNEYTKKLKPDRILKHHPGLPLSADSEKDFENLFISTLPVTGDMTIFQTLLELEYEDYVLSSERRQELAMLTDFLVAIRKDTGMVPHQVEGTAGQRDSPHWHTARALRITASNSKLFAKTSTSRGMFSLLNKTLWGHSIRTTMVHFH